LTWSSGSISWCVIIHITKNTQCCILVLVSQLGGFPFYDSVSNFKKNFFPEFFFEIHEFKSLWTHPFLKQLQLFNTRCLTIPYLYAELHKEQLLQLTMKSQSNGSGVDIRRACAHIIRRHFTAGHNCHTSLTLLCR